jgi:hypothetical protein
MKILAIIAMLLPIAAIEQCRADYSLWKGDTKVNHIAASDLDHRAELLSLCAIVAGSQHGDSLTAGDLAETQNYSALALFYARGASARYRSFIQRHRQWKEFLREDVAGVH